MSDIGEVIKTQQLRLNQMLVFERIGYSMASTAKVEVDYDIDFDMMRVRLEAYVLQEHLADDYYTERHTVEYPRSPWQKMKAEKRWLRWWTKMFSVKTGSYDVVLGCKVERYVNYPEAHVALPHLGHPYIYERVKPLPELEARKVDAEKEEK